MKKQVQIKPTIYVKTAILPAIIVTALASILPIVSHIFVQGNVPRLFVTLFTSVISTLIVVFSVGITKQERKFAIQFVMNRLNLKRAS